jgi:two-component system chemotaxis response regulator CheB
MHPRDVVVVGASAGGLAPLRSLVGGLAPDFPGSLFVVRHLSPTESTSLADLLGRAGPLPALEVDERRAVERGRVYVAGPNRHLVLEPGFVRSVTGPRENRFRPSIDVLFRSAAISYGDRTVGIVLSGLLDDGAAGLAVVKTTGGVTIVQDPTDAEHPSMPESALRASRVDHRLPVAAMPALLESLARHGTPEPALPAPTSPRPTADPSFSCPACNGPLHHVQEAGVDRYRCVVGHAFSEESLASEHDENVERALWTALRVLEERVALQVRLANTAKRRGLEELAAMHAGKARAAQRDAAYLREAVRQDLDDASAD